MMVTVNLSITNTIIPVHVYHGKSITFVYVKHSIIIYIHVPYNYFVMKFCVSTRNKKYYTVFLT